MNLLDIKGRNRQVGKRSDDAIEQWSKWYTKVEFQTCAAAELGRPKLVKVEAKGKHKSWGGNTNNDWESQEAQWMLIDGQTNTWKDVFGAVW